MRKTKNLFFLLVSVFLLFLNFELVSGRLFPSAVYLVALDVILAVIMVLDILGTAIMAGRINFLFRENEKFRLAISDYEVESKLLSTVIGSIETFSSEMNLEDSLNRITDSVKTLFENETVLLQLFRENFISVRRGKQIDIPHEVFEEVILKGHPILVNNPASFPQYTSFASQNIQAFIVAPLKKETELMGVLGVFAFENRTFSLKDMHLLRMVSVSVTLMIENAELFEKTKALSITDGLTQIYNRRHFEEMLEKIVDEARRTNQEVTLCIGDIDYFKHYNDTNGHPAGDRVLREIADILKRNVKGRDLVARYGGEEFVIIFPGTSKENARWVCNMLNRKIRMHRFVHEEKQPNGDITISFGVANLPGTASTAEQLLQEADTALYRAKHEGRDRVVVADSGPSPTQ